MNSSKFIHGYGKVSDHLEDQPSFLRSPNRKPLVAFIFVLAILFLTLSVGVTLGPLSTPSTANTGVTASIRTICNVTRFPASCYSSISSLTTSLQKPNDPESILKLSLRVSTTNSLSFRPPRTLASTSSVTRSPRLRLQMQRSATYEAWIGAAMTDQKRVCMDWRRREPAVGEMKGKMQRSREYTSNCLAIVANIRILLQRFNMSLH
ncbi:hypothetical protein K1719_046243 [Acacia pycnantha]|nr:hypothetical protein K1719_046243 [Acacia pycnantha]